MDSSSGNSSGSAQIQFPESDERKQKRMQSNRESARRSRVRKQKHLDELMGEIKQLKNDNREIIITMKITRQQFVQTEEENSVLKATIGELSQRLDFLNEIINCMYNYTIDYGTNWMDEFEQPDFLNNPWNLVYMNQQPIMASASDVFLH